MTNRYLIQKKIKTPICAEQEFTVRDYKIAPYKEPFQNDLLVTREVQALNVIDAMKVFLIELEPIVNTVAILTQTMIYPLAMGSMMAYRLNDNKDGYFFAQVANESETVGISLNSEMIEDVGKLLAANKSVACAYLREAINAFSLTQQISMLLSAAEALAGTGTTQGACKECNATYSYQSTNKDALQNVLSKDLYAKIYQSTRMRHKLAHGGNVEIPEAPEIAEKVYSQIILGHLKKTYELESLCEITAAPRGLSFEYSRCTCKQVVLGIPKLQTVESEWEDPTTFCLCLGKDFPPNY